MFVRVESDQFPDKTSGSSTANLNETCILCGGFMFPGVTHVCSWTQRQVNLGPHQCCWRDETLEPEPGVKLMVQRCTNLLCNALRLVAQWQSAKPAARGLKRNRETAGK